MARFTPEHDPLAGLPPAVRAQMREGYLDEAGGLADDLEAALLALERSPDQIGAIDAAFRAAHTIKGSGAAVGCHAIAGFTHQLENALDALRARTARLSEAGLASLLAGVDTIRALIAAERAGTSVPGTDAAAARIASAFSGADVVTAGSAGSTAGLSDGTAALAAAELHDVLAHLGAEDLQALHDEVDARADLYRVRFVLPESAFIYGLDPLVLLRALADEGRPIATIPLLDRLPTLDLLDPAVCYLGFATLVATHAAADDLRAVFEFCPDDAVVEIQRIHRQDLAGVAGERERAEQRDGERAGWKRLGELLVEERLVRPEDLDRVLERQRSLGGEPAATGAADAEGGRVIKVKQARLDGFIDLVGELVTARNALLHLQGVVETEYDVPALARRLKETTATINRTVSQLQTDVLALRMVPVRTVFQRLTRVARDVSAKQGKQADVRFAGEDTEVDKTVADALLDPLIHLVRNAVDHGLEAPDVRRAAGKDPLGQVLVSAAREGNAIVVEVRDDGAGIDPVRLRRAAVAKGVLDEASAAGLADDEALNLVFAAGLSTAKEISDISGRGVGMDVARSNVAKHGGTIGVSSDVGRGTTFRLQLPLTLSVYRALMVRAADTTFGLPLDAVRATAAVTPATCEHVYGRPVAEIEGRLVGLVRLADALALGNGRPARTGAGPESVVDAEASWEVVVVECGADRVGLIVEALEQPQEIMVKPLDSYLTAGGAVAGASVMGDGRVALILDPAGTVRLALEQAQSGRLPSPPAPGGPHAPLESPHPPSRSPHPPSRSPHPPSPSPDTEPLDPHGPAHGRGRGARTDRLPSPPPWGGAGGGAAPARLTAVSGGRV